MAGVAKREDINSQAPHALKGRDGAGPGGKIASPEPKRRQAMTWAQRLKRVFRIDIEVCEHCGGAVRIIASIEDPAVIEKILTHLERRQAAGVSPHAPRAPPANSSGDSP